jgi:hypothetical protein
MIYISKIKIIGIFTILKIYIILMKGVIVYEYHIRRGKSYDDT